MHSRSFATIAASLLNRNADNADPSGIVPLRVSMQTGRHTKHAVSEAIALWPTGRNIKHAVSQEADVGTGNGSDVV